LSCSKKEAGPPLILVLFDLTQRYFFDQNQREKNEKFGIFRGNFPNPDPNQRWLTHPDPGHKILTWSHQ